MSPPRYQEFPSVQRDIKCAACGIIIKAGNTPVVVDMDSDPKRRYHLACNPEQKKDDAGAWDAMRKAQAEREAAKAEAAKAKIEAAKSKESKAVSPDTSAAALAPSTKDVPSSHYPIYESLRVKLALPYDRPAVESVTLRLAGESEEAFRARAVKQATATFEPIVEWLAELMRKTGGQ